jgi:hypothetical protein
MPGVASYMAQYDQEPSSDWNQGSAWHWNSHDPDRCTSSDSDKVRRFFVRGRVLLVGH